MDRAAIPATLSELTVPIDGLTPYGNNPRRGDLDVIVDSLQRHGQYRPIVVRAKTFEVLAGNHTLAAAKQLGWTELAATFVDVSDDEAARIVLVDNRSADLGTYDDQLLAELLSGLGDDLAGTGYTDEDLLDLEQLLKDSENWDGEGSDRDRAPTTGELLTIADVSWGEPNHHVTHGQVWTVGRHTMVIAHLQREHAMWRHLLDDDMVFAPYPEPYLTSSDLAADTTLLLVQPNVYLAGHLLDKHASMFPDERVELQP